MHRIATPLLLAAAGQTIAPPWPYASSILIAIWQYACVCTLNYPVWRLAHSLRACVPQPSGSGTLRHTVAPLRAYAYAYVETIARGATCASSGLPVWGG